MTPLARCLSSLRSRRAVALCNNAPLARSVVEDACRTLGVALTVKRLDRYTDLFALLGDPRNPVSYGLAEFYRMARSGGLLLIEVLEAPSDFAPFEPLLPRGHAVWRIPDYASFGHFDAHPDFHLVLSLARESDRRALPPSLSSRLDIIELEPESAPAVDTPTAGVELGPGSVLVLMKFGVPQYEQWYQSVLEPVISRHGRAVRVDTPVEDWQSDVTRAIDRADAVVIDVPADEITDNLRWEMNRLWQIYRHAHSSSITRRKMILAARGTGAVVSCHPQREFVYSSELGPEWISDMPKKSARFEDLLGFEIRRYDASTEGGRQAFMAWLGARLLPLVQNVPAPVSDRELARLAEELRARGGDRWIAAWSNAIAKRDFDACIELTAHDPVPLSLSDLVGTLLATVTASAVASVNGYWQLVKAVLANSPRLRDHFMALLATEQLAARDPFMENMCENIWFAFSPIVSRLPAAERERLSALAMREQRMTIREVSDSVRVALLPEGEQHEMMTTLLMEHLAASRKRPC